MNKNKLITAIMIAGLGFVAGTAVAEKQLSADEVKALFIGKTADGINVVKDKTYQIYTKDESNAIHKNAKRTKDVTWKVTDTGEHCVQLSQFKGSRCGHIIDMGNGVYHKVRDGEHTNTMKNFREGNQIGK